MLDSQTQLLGQYMDLLTLQQRVTASNIANADTPGYRTKGFDFQWELARAMKQPKAERLSPVAIDELGSLAVKNDGNDVSLERELRVLSETTIRYRMIAQWVRGNVQALRGAIQEGRG